MSVITRNKSVCMPVYSYYPFDPRVRRAAEALVEKGHSVDVICLRGEGESSSGSFNGVGIHRISLTHKRGGYLRYIYHYTMFFILVFITLNRLDLKKRYDAVHVHSLPDFLVFVAIVQKLRGRTIVLDLHEVMPEIFAARFGKTMGSPMVNVVCFIERKSTSFADHVITVNDVRKEVIVQRGVAPNKITVIMNSPDERVFVKKNIDDFKKRLGLDGKFITVYVGGINPERNLEVIIMAMALVRKEIPGIYFLLFGHYYGQEGSGYVEELKTLARELDLESSVYFGGELRGEDVASYIDLADFGVVSYLANPMTELAMPNKVFEYAALDVPIISCRVKGIYSLLGDEAALYFEPENENDLANNIVSIYHDEVGIEKMVEKARRIYRKCTWSEMKRRLFTIYNGP